MTAQELGDLLEKTGQPRIGPVIVPKRSKYSAVKTEVFGITFDSKREAARYQVLKLLEQADQIRGLERQKVLRLEVNGFLVCKYVCDFFYIDCEHGEVWEDVKGMKTRAYSIKKKLVKAIYGIDIKEV